MRQKKCQKLQCNGRQPERTTGATEEKKQSRWKKMQAIIWKMQSG